ncbi:unnamed protein product [Closterium sp. NIES-65]|nr:unnamed protein product [Closterium sp. NIES-65]
MAHGCFLHSSVIVSAAPSPGTLGGTVRLIFQPAEEGGAGGKRMVDGGALKGASAAFALHVSPKIPAGYVGSRPGMLLAGSGRFNATVWGKGGHAAMPQFAADPILAAAHIVSSFQAKVVSVTQFNGGSAVNVIPDTVTLRGTYRATTKDGLADPDFHGGSADNVIPDTVTLRGTYRATTKDGLADLERRIADIIDTQARVFGCRGEVDYGMMDANLQADAGADGGGGDEATKAAESESEGAALPTGVALHVVFVQQYLSQGRAEA